MVSHRCEIRDENRKSAVRTLHPSCAFRSVLEYIVSIRARRTPYKLRKLLVIDDDLRLLASYRDLLSPYGFEVLTAPDGGKGLQACAQNGVDLVITDLFMPEKEGCETIVELRRAWPAIKIIAVSGGSKTGKDCLPIARALGAHRTLSKPISLKNLLEAVRDVIGASPHLPCGESERNVDPA